MVWNIHLNQKMDHVNIDASSIMHKENSVTNSALVPNKQFDQCRSRRKVMGYFFDISTATSSTSSCTSSTNSQNMKLTFSRYGQTGVDHNSLSAWLSEYHVGFFLAVVGKSTIIKIYTFKRACNTSWTFFKWLYNWGKQNAGSIVWIFLKEVGVVIAACCLSAFIDTFWFKRQFGNVSQKVFFY